MIAFGPQPADEVSRLFAAMDVALMSFIDGVSTRRSSFMTALSHGVATVTTFGKATGPLLREAAERQCFLAAAADDPAAYARAVNCLAADAAYRARVARAGEAWAERHVGWPRAAERVLAVFSTGMERRST
jgi:glycosyltransferase involved in cell wall biosynthesis